MTTEKTTSKNAAESAGTFWMLLPVFLLGASVLGWIVMIRMAGQEPGAVEPNYYAKASRFDQDKERRASSEKLGWTLALRDFSNQDGAGKILVALRDAGGEPVTGASLSAEAFQNAGADRVQNVVFEEVEPGQYLSVVARPRPGLWEFRVNAKRGESEFISVLRPELARGGT